MAYNLIGKNFTPMDVEAKVTGRAMAGPFAALAALAPVPSEPPAPLAPATPLPWAPSSSQVRCAGTTAYDTPG